MRALAEILVGCFLFGLLCFGLAKLEDRTKAWHCDRHAAATGETVKYVNWTGCYVQRGGKWRPLNQLRSAED